MTSVDRYRWYVRMLRLLFGGLFVYSGWLKILLPLDFADSIATFRVFPSALINLIALSLPPVEVILGLILIVGWKTRAATSGVIFLVALFVILLVQAALRGIPVDCGCLGSESASMQATYVSLARAVAVWLGLILLHGMDRRFAERFRLDPSEIIDTRSVN